MNRRKISYIGCIHTYAQNERTRSARLARDCTRGCNHPIRRTVDDGALADGKGKKRREDPCCEICEGDHVSLDCQIYSGPKPHAILCGFGSGESGFFQIPTFGSKGLIPLKESSTAFITAKEGTITAELVKPELARFIPVR
jgi:hypothetical protein